ncbi:MAG TPA: alpha/beta hydrolase [Chitinophagaceae bacterium]|nr:alpha/beta hydrolase [Chitinophagaceae bacterium]
MLNAIGRQTTNDSSGFANINGITMYYEIHGVGPPLVLIHGGGSTIQSSFGRIIPKLKQRWKLVCMELQAHGRTADRNIPISFQQDAEDVYGLLKFLDIKKAYILGFSNGANTALQLAINHPDICRKVIAGSALLKRNGTLPQFWEFMEKGSFDQMPVELKDAFLEVNPDPAALQNMYRKCAARMLNFEDFPDVQLRSIESPVLLLNGESDVATSEHMVAMAELIPHARLAILPGGHGDYIGELCTLKPGYSDTDFAVPLIEEFLNGDDQKSIP